MFLLRRQVGNITKRKDIALYRVTSIKELEVIINHFDRYSLITQKLSDYLIFKQCFNLIKQKEHLTEKGLLEIMSLKGSLNLAAAAAASGCSCSRPDKIKMA